MSDALVAGIVRTAAREVARRRALEEAAPRRRRRQLTARMGGDITWPESPCLAMSGGGEQAAARCRCSHEGER
ncbi:MAG: hypothetical protein ACREQ5_41020 [Candidatus Dormibacteria bacterium]